VELAVPIVAPPCNALIVALTIGVPSTAFVMRPERVPVLFTAKFTPLLAIPAE